MAPAQESAIVIPDFHSHMKEKANLWEPFELILGKNFAVFEFDTVETRDVAVASFKHYESTYGYTSYVGGREQLVIVKGDIK